jgi:hypothetical protein
MPHDVSQRPHRHTYGMWVIGLAVVILLAVAGWLIKASGQTATFNGPVTIGPGGASVNNGTILNQAPAPQFKVLGERSVEGKPYITVKVDSPYPPGQLILVFEGEGVTGADVNPLDAGMVQVGHKEEPNKVTLFIDHPTGRYDIGVDTTKPGSKINLSSAFK